MRSMQSDNVSILCEAATKSRISWLQGNIGAENRRLTPALIFLTVSKQDDWKRVLELRELFSVGPV